jgi:hypothetical protein
MNTNITGLTYRQLCKYLQDKYDALGTKDLTITNKQPMVI